MLTKTIQIGDRVRYTTTFLSRIGGQYAYDLRDDRGTVVGMNTYHYGQFAAVLWDGYSVLEAFQIRLENLEVAR